MEDDLEVLLAFQNGDRVPETPPASPSTAAYTRHSNQLNLAYAKKREWVPTPDEIHPKLTVQEALEAVFGYDSDNDDVEDKKNITMAAFKDVLSTSLNTASCNASTVRLNKPVAPTVNGTDIESHSGLRIRNRLVPTSSLNNQLSDIRFVRLQAMRAAMIGETILGAWATVGVLTEKGMPKVSSTGKNFVIWKLSTLDTSTVPLFLFGDAYIRHWKESAGSIMAVLNAKVRRDDKRNEFSLTVFSGDQLTKLGTSVDYCICKGLRKDGTSCSIVVNRRHGEYCQYHVTANQQKYKSRRGELSGGNLGKANLYSIRGLQRMDDISESVADKKLEKPAKHMTSRDLKKVLSNADKVTTKYQSQGIRFLASLADRSRENMDPKASLKRQNKEQHGPTQKRVDADKRVELSTLQQALKEKSQKESIRHGLIELDIEGPDDAMAQAISFFQRGEVLQ